MTKENISISDSASSVRGFIDAPWMQHICKEDIAYWHMLCSSLDAIEDTELAIDAYFSSSDDIEVGTNYLLIYGILQCLFVQQDAVCHIAESLSINIEKDDSLKQIRDIRNKAVGHPTKTGGGKGKSHNFLSRFTMNKFSFDLMITYPNNEHDIKSINIPGLIEMQQDKLVCAMSKIIQELKKREMKYKDEYKKNGKLQNVFPNTLGHCLSAIVDTTSAYSSRREYGTVNCGVIEDVLNNFNKELEARKLSEAYPGLKHVLKQIQYPLEELKKFFNKSDESKLNNEDAYIFATYLKLRFEEIVDMAKEIDTGFEK